MFKLCQDKTRDYKYTALISRQKVCCVCVHVYACVCMSMCPRYMGLCMCPCVTLKKQNLGRMLRVISTVKCTAYKSQLYLKIAFTVFY